MKNNIKIFALGLLTLGLTMASCENEVELPKTASPTTVPTDILSFKTQAEFDSTLQKVNAMSEEQRKEWEKSKGFKSFGTECDEFYKTIKPEKFSDIEEIKSYVEAHKSKIQLIQDETGEISCVTQDYNNPERFIINRNRMFIVGNKAYKVFPEQKKVSCDISNITELTKIKDFSEICKNQYPLLEINENQKVSASTNSFDPYIERTDKKSIGSKNYRTTVRVETITLFWNSLGMPGSISYVMWYRIRNQSQFIVWFDEYASTKYAPFNYTISNGVENFNGNLSNNWVSSFTETIKDKDGYIGSYPYHEPKQSTASPYIINFEGFVYSTFTRDNKKITTTVNLKYPY